MVTVRGPNHARLSITALLRPRMALGDRPGTARLLRYITLLHLSDSVACGPSTAVRGRHVAPRRSTDLIISIGYGLVGRRRLRCRSVRQSQTSEALWSGGHATGRKAATKTSTAVSMAYVSDVWLAGMDRSCRLSRNSLRGYCRGRHRQLPPRQSLAAAVIREFVPAWPRHGRHKRRSCVVGPRDGPNLRGGSRTRPEGR